MVDGHESLRTVGGDYLAPHIELARAFLVRWSARDRPLCSVGGPGARWSGPVSILVAPGRFSLEPFHVSLNVIGHFAQHCDRWHVVRCIRETAALLDARAHIGDHIIGHAVSIHSRSASFRRGCVT